MFVCFDLFLMLSSEILFICEVGLICGSLYYDLKFYSKRAYLIQMFVYHDFMYYVKLSTCNVLNP